MTITLLKGITDLESLKKEYKKLAMKYHPDRGGDAELMKKLNAEYDYLSIKLNKETGKKYQYNNDAMQMYKEVIDKLINFEGIVIELVGSWLWVSGDTKQAKKELKEMKFFWNKTRSIWQRKPEGYENVKFNRSRLETEDLKEAIGYEVLAKTEKRTENINNKKIS